MLVTLKHLVVLILLAGVGASTGGVVQANIGLGEFMGTSVVLLSAILVPLLLGWPVFRLLSLRPLILPLCPHCGKRHGNYHLPRGFGPEGVIICVHCEKPLRLVLTGAGSHAPSELPTVTLRWPGFLGLWRPVAPGPATAVPEKPRDL